MWPQETHTDRSFPRKSGLTYDSHAWGSSLAFLTPARPSEAVEILIL